MFVCGVHVRVYFCALFVHSLCFWFMRERGKKPGQDK